MKPIAFLISLVLAAAIILGTPVIKDHRNPFKKESWRTRISKGVEKKFEKMKYEAKKRRKAIEEAQEKLKQARASKDQDKIDQAEAKLRKAKGEILAGLGDAKQGFQKWLRENDPATGTFLDGVIDSVKGEDEDETAQKTPSRPSLQGHSRTN